MADGYADLALAYLANGFFPIPVQQKHPVPQGATGHAGTVTPEKVDQWLSDEAWNDQNLALRAHGFIGIDVDHYGDKLGATQLQELEFQLGELPVTMSSTARGPESASRIYYYAVPDGVNFVTKAAPDIDIIQRSHRYAMVYPSWHPDTGTQYEWYDESGEVIDDIPQVNDFENLPQAWLDYLKVEPITSHDGFSGSIDEWLNTLSDGEPSYRVKKWLEQVPADNFNHDDVIRLTYSLVRLGAEGDSGVRQAMQHLYNLWVKPPYDTPEYTRELTTAINGAIQKAGAKQDYDLPRYSEVLGKIPEPTLSKLLGKPLEKGQVRVIREVASLNLDRPEILSIGMGAPTLRGAWGYERLCQIVDEILSEKALRAGQNIEPPEVTPLEDGPERRVVLLSDDERAKVETANNFITKYDQLASKKLPARNYPYHIANALTCLSVMFSDSGFIPAENRRGTNLYILISGYAGSLKSENATFANRLLDKFWSEDPDWNLGGNFSESALGKALLNRDGKVSSIWKDDVHGWFKQVMKEGWQSGIIEELAYLFDGRVGKMLRSGDKEVNGKVAKANVVMHLQGTTEELHRVLSREFLTNGFISRLLIFQGEKIKPTRESLKVKYVRYGEHNEPEQDEINPWVEELQRNRLKIRSRYGPSPIYMDQDAQDRLSEAKYQITKLIPESHIDYWTLNPSFMRAGMMAEKIAALLAMSRGVKQSNLDDVLYALYVLEQALTNLFDFSKKLAANEYERETNAMYNFVASRRGGKVKRSTLMNTFIMKLNDFDGMVRSLIGRGLLQEETVNNVEWLIAKGLD